jgi:hypothetical protein
MTLHLISPKFYLPFLTVYLRLPVWILNAGELLPLQLEALERLSDLLQVLLLLLLLSLPEMEITRNKNP